MRFTKVHGLGNDFVMLDDRGGAISSSHDVSALAVRLCHRQAGIGGDGIILVCDSDSCDIRMRIINNDGSEAEMCGNGIRCFAKYVYERGIVTKPELTVETLAGVIRPKLIFEGGKITGIKVDMGVPSFERAAIPMLGEGECMPGELTIDGKKLEICSMLMGVPHTMVFVEDATDCDMLRVGALVQNDPVFPRKTNVNFVQVIDDRTLRVRTYERGCGPTLTCGTGSSATAVATFLTGRTGREVDIQLELGTLHIEYNENGRVYMTGPAELVFSGEYSI